MDKSETGGYSVLLRSFEILYGKVMMRKKRKKRKKKKKKKKEKKRKKKRMKKRKKKRMEAVLPEGRKGGM